MTVPTFLEHLPVDPRRKLPVPVMNQHATGTDFTAISGERVVKAAQDRTCGICGKELGYWLAFIGGPISYRSRQYADPPMHPECAEASFTLCPHMAIGRARRATGTHLMTGATTPEHFGLDKPEVWVMGITRSYTYSMQPAQGGGVVVVFRAAPFKDAKAFAYDDTGSLAPCALPTL